MKRRVAAHFGFIVGLMGKHEVCHGDAYFTLRGQSYPQAASDFPDIVDGLSLAMIVNKLRLWGRKRQSPFCTYPIMTCSDFYPVSN
jgi:hypothetical protein